MTEAGIHLMASLFGAFIGTLAIIMLVIMVVTVMVKVVARVATMMGFDQLEFRMNYCVPEGIKEAEKYANSPAS